MGIQVGSAVTSLPFTSVASRSNPRMERYMLIGFSVPNCMSLPDLESKPEISSSYTYKTLVASLQQTLYHEHAHILRTMDLPGSSAAT